MTTLSDTKICFIGAGAMATAMISGICKQELVPPHHITASDPYPTQLEKLASAYGINTTPNNREAVVEADIVVFAIKPQSLGKVGGELKGHIPAPACLLSIIAGMTITALQEQTSHNHIVRVMPNTPALIGKGMSAWTCTPTVNEIQREQAQAMLSALGEATYFDNEDFLDMATSLSGGGPAYVFLFMEALIDAAVHMGMSRVVAEQFVYQTVEGSVLLARESGQHPVQLRNMVTSPGGTTVEAIYELEQGGFRTAISKAIWAAYKKSQHLGSLHNHG